MLRESVLLQEAVAAASAVGIWLTISTVAAVLSVALNLLM
jgi:hypothetical protein